MDVDEFVSLESAAFKFHVANLQTLLGVLSPAWLPNDVHKRHISEILVFFFIFRVELADPVYLIFNSGIDVNIAVGLVGRKFAMCFVVEISKRADLVGYARLHPEAGKRETKPANCQVDGFLTVFL